MTFFLDDQSKLIITIRLFFFSCLDLHPGNIIVQCDENNLKTTTPRLSLIDAGIAVELGPDDRRNFIDLFNAVINNDGKRVGSLMIERSRGRYCHDPEGFSVAMGKIVSEVHAAGLSLGRIGISSLLQNVLVLCYRHQVKLESHFSSVIIAIGILEGLGRRLDHDINILAIATPYILKAYAKSYFSST